MKDLEHAPIWRKISKSEMRRDFDEFLRKMRLKCLFQDKLTSYFREKSVFRSLIDLEAT